MRKRTFCGMETSVIALGTMDFGGKIAEGQAYEYMDAYSEMGGNFIDTARIYGDFAHEIQGGSEEVIGRWMEQRRNRKSILLSTKGGHPDPHAMHIGRLDRQSICADISRSLEALRTDYADIYWLHRDDTSRPVCDILETLTDLRERGMIRYAGVSNWTPERIMEANACAERHGLISVYANQPQFSLARQGIVEDPTLCQMDRETYTMHIDASMPCVCFSAQAKGFLTKMAAGGEESLSAKAHRRFYNVENLGVFERAKEVAAQTGLSVNAVSLAYLTCQPFPCFPIAGMSRMEHVEALREAGDAVLTERQCEYLRSYR